MKQDYRQLFKPEIINSVSGLALIAKMTVEGHLSGLHNSRRVGSGMEFSQYRGYEPGDDLRLLDWKMLARSGRYNIKQAEVETHVAIKFILDSSKSMLHKERALSKMDYVRILVASLAYLAKEQGDAVGLFALNDTHLHSLYPTIQKQHYNRFLHELITITNSGKWPQDPRDAKKLHDRSHKELIFFVTDMYEHNDELTKTIKSLKTARNEVVVLHVMGTNEMEFNYSGAVTFEDLETGATIKVDTKNAKETYLNNLKIRLESIKNTLLASNIGYELFNIDQPLGEALQVFLKNRSRLI